jgi:hypothetical protein
MWQRVSAVLCLFVVSPLVAEYLLGSLPMSMLVALPVMALLYGSGAVLVRELARRTGRGWATMLLLACAYGVVEEGLITQSLFNPNYLHLRLLDYGYLPALGTAAPWLIYVIGLHVAWSIGVPIGLIDALFVDRRTEPWLGRPGLAVVSVLFLAGAALVASFTYKQAPFIASSAQLGVTVAVVIALVVVAFLLPKTPPAAAAGRAPHPVVVFLVAFLCGSGFVGALLWAPVFHLPWIATTALLLGCVLGTVAFTTAFARKRAWTDRHRFALAAAGLCVYTWLGFVNDHSMHPGDPLAPHVALVCGFAVLAWIAGARAFARTLA